MLFAADTLGTSLPITVAGVAGTISLPALIPSAADRGFGAVVAPDSFDDAVLGVAMQQITWLEWGRQVSQPSGNSEVYSVLMAFDLESDLEPARHQMSRIENRFGAWFSHLRDWLEVLTEQDLSVDEPLKSMTSVGGGYWSWNDGSGPKVTTPAVRGVRIRWKADPQPVTRSMWVNALARSNDLERPPAPYLLLRDARARLLRMQSTYSVIFAAIAAEVVLKDTIRDRLYGFGLPESFVQNMTSTTLGRLESVCKDLSIDLPIGFHQNVTEARNRAMHKNAVLELEVAQRANELVGEVLANYRPLESPAT